MKKLLLLIGFVFMLSCEEKNIPDICWECTAIIYGNAVNDTVCYDMITDIEDYKARMYEFYQGGCTSVECEMVPDTTNKIK